MQQAVPYSDGGARRYNYLVVDPFSHSSVNYRETQVLPLQLGGAVCALRCVLIYKK